MISDNRHLISGVEFSQLARLHRRSSRSSSNVEQSGAQTPSSSPNDSTVRLAIQPRRRFFR